MNPGAMCEFRKTLPLLSGVDHCVHLWLNLFLLPATLSDYHPWIPVSQTDGHDSPRLVDELVPGVAAVIDDVDA